MVTRMTGLIQIIIFIVIVVIFKSFLNGKEQMEKDEEQERKNKAGQEISSQMDRRVSSESYSSSERIHPSQPVKKEPVKAIPTGSELDKEASTLDYLAQKAEMDRKAHEQEKREEAAKMQMRFEGRRTAERLIEGDSVPKGRKMITCGYCGAANLVPENAREKYNCYFCREQL